MFSKPDTTVVGLARGIVEHKVDELDADPDLLNTPSGVVDLMTGGVISHDPEFLITKVTHGSYRPGCAHLDWMKALEALPGEERKWLQVVIGQAITGHPNPNDFMAVLQGSGENGKSAITIDGLGQRWATTPPWPAPNCSSRRPLSTPLSERSCGASDW